MDTDESDQLWTDINNIMEINLTCMVNYFIQGCCSKKEFSKFVSRERLENYLWKYLKSLVELVGLCAEYEEGTSLYDTIIKAEGEVRGNGTTNSSNAIFDELQKETNRVAISIDNSDILVFVLKMMDDFSMFWEDEKIRKTLTEVIEKLPEENAEILLDCEKICQQPCFDSFLCRLLMRCEDGDLRNKAYEILISRDCIINDRSCLVELERLCRARYRDVFRECLAHVNEEKMITFSCFEKLSQSFSSRETEEIIKKINELNLQPIPMYFVEEFKKYATTVQPGVIGIGKLLIERKYCEITDIGCIRRLIDDADASSVVDLFDTALKVANDIPNNLIKKLERKPDPNGKITPLLSKLRKIFDNESEVDILENPRIDLVVRERSLDEIKRNDKYHNNGTIKLLEKLIKYDDDMREKCFEALTSILPQNYSKSGYSLNLQTVISSMALSTVDLRSLIDELLKKDRSIDLSGSVTFFIESNCSNSLEDAVPLFNVLSYSNEDEERGQTIIADNLSVLLKKASFISNSVSRDNVCEKLMDIWKLGRKTFELPDNVLNLYQGNFSIEEIDDAFLDQLEQHITEGYPVSEKFITLIFDTFENGHFENNWFKITTILSLIHSIQGLGSRAEDMLKVFRVMRRNTQTFRDSFMVDKFVDIISEITVPKTIQSQFDVIISNYIHEVNESCVQKNLLKFANVVFKDYKLTSDVLEKATEMLNSSEDINDKLLIAEFLTQQITYIKKPSKVASSVINRLKTIALQSNGIGYWKLRNCAFQAVEEAIEENESSKDFLNLYYRNLKTKTLESNVLTSTSVDLLDIYLNAKETTNLAKFRLLKMISYVLSNEVKINMDEIFSKCEENIWLEVLLMSTLTASALQCSEKTAENKSLTQRLWENLSFLKRYAKNLYQLNSSVYQPANQSDQAMNPIYFFEDTLHRIIHKQKQFGFNISTINEISEMLCSSRQAFNTIFSQSNRFHFDLKEVWIENSLANHGITSSNEDKLEMCRFLKYGIMVLETVFNKVKKPVAANELLKFFRMVEKYLPSLKDRRHFLVDEIVSQTSISHWIQQLNGSSLKIMLKNNLAVSAVPVSFAASAVPALTKMLKNNLSVPAVFGSVSRDHHVENRNENKRTGHDVDNTTTADEGNQMLQSLHAVFYKLKEIGWHIESIEMLVELVRNQNKQKDLLNALNTVVAFRLREYETSEDGDNLLNIFRSSPPKDWVKYVNNIMICRIFPGTYTKPVNTLAKEICKLNENEHELVLLNEAQLIAEYENIVGAYENKSIDNFITSDKISKWSETTIRLWAKNLKKLRTGDEKESVSIYEKIAVAKRAVEVVTSPSITPRAVQLLSLLFMLKKEKDKGRLMQINTGEGKTTIIAMFAAIKALEGHTVDVITSSPELAKPQSKQQEIFFKCFGLTVSHNETESTKDCYKADIVYGSANTFMGDVLRDEYHKQKVRYDRIFDVVVVDEVDSMLLDGKDHIVMLSSPMPSLDHLEPVLAAIWTQLHESANAVVEKEGVLYYRKPLLKANSNKEEEVEYDMVPLDCTVEQFLKKATETHLKKMLGVTQDGEDPIPEDYPKLEIPKHLRLLITRVQLSNWIDSAIRALYRCEEGKDYVIKENCIVPVDATNTGMLQLNMLWSNGLHQFLQFKHGLNVTPESLTTNFISNVTFFKRYKCNLYGLTGTLGSIVARNLLKETYIVDGIIIPPFQKKQYLELNAILANTVEDWFQNIVRSSLIHLRNGRAVLIITKYIEDADKILETFKNFKYDTKKIKMYRTADDSDAINGELKAGELIIATNIAGRGTDIIPSTEVENNGGLHVCVTFVPINERIEVQNKGRTSRTGNKGTGQFVLMEEDELDICILKESRNKEEEISLKKAKEDMAKVIVKDDIFQKFCELLNDVSPPSQNSINSLQKRAVEERFAIWLKMKEGNLTSEMQNDMVEEFKHFESEIKSDAKTKTLPQNPCYHILAGNAFLSEEKYDEAVEQYSKAIKMDEDFVADAYYYRAFVYIAKYGSDVKKNADEMEKVTADLKKAEKIIVDGLELMICLLSFASKGELFVEQIRRKMKLLSIQKNSILSAAGCNVDNLVNDLQTKREEMSQDDKAIVDKKIDEYRENRQLYEKGIIRNAIDEGMDLDVEFQNKETLFPEEDIATYKTEMAENSYNGQIGYFHVKERKPVFRCSILLIIGIAAILAGVCLILLTGGLAAGIGYALAAAGTIAVVSVAVSAVIDGMFSKNKKIQIWESCGIRKFVLFEVFFRVYGLKAIEHAANSFSQGDEALQKEERNVVQEISTEGKILGEKVSEKIQVEMDKVLDDISNDDIDAFFQINMPDRIFKNIRVQFQCILAKHEKILKELQPDKDNMTSINEKIVFYINKLLSQKSWKDWFKEKLNRFKIWKSTSRSKNIPVADIEKTLQEMCNDLPGEFESTLNQIEQNLDFTSSSFDEKENRHRKKGNVPQEQVELVKTSEELADTISSKLSASIADRIREKLVSPVLSSAPQMDNINEMGKKFNDWKEQEYPSSKNKSKDVSKSFVESSVVGNVADVETLTENAKVGLMGIQHLDSISRVIKHKIVVRDQRGKNMCIVGDSNLRTLIHIQWHKSDNSEYWTSPGKKKQHSLLNVVAEQVNINPEELKKIIVKELEENSRTFSDKMNYNRTRNFCWENVLTDIA